MNPSSGSPLRVQAPGPSLQARVGGAIGHSSLRSLHPLYLLPILKKWVLNYLVTLSCLAEQLSPNIWPQGPGPVWEASPHLLLALTMDTSHGTAEPDPGPASLQRAQNSSCSSLASLTDAEKTFDKIQHPFTAHKQTCVHAPSKEAAEGIPQSDSRW